MLGFIPIYPTLKKIDIKGDKIKVGGKRSKTICVTVE